MIDRENKKPCIAIDVSKGCSHYRGFYQAGIPACDAMRFDHTKEGFSKLLDLRKEMMETGAPEPVIVFENTGTYSRVVEVFCERNQLIHYEVPPLLSAKTRKSEIRPTKTDKVDCETIANTYFLKRMSASKPMHNLYTKLKTLCSYYNYKIGLQRSLKVKYREYLDLVYPRIDTMFEVYSNSFMKLLAKYPSPYKLQKRSKKELTEFFNKIDYCGIAKAQRQAILVSEYFKTIEIPVSEDDALIDILSCHIHQLMDLMEENEKILEQIVSLGAKTKEYPYLLSIPGITKASAARIAAEICGIERFVTSSKFVAYIGIDPIVHSSGTQKGEHLSITKKGNKRLRCLLYLVVTGTSKSTALNNPVRDFVTKKKSDGLPPKVAIIAGCNKLARIIFAVCSNKQMFIANQ